MLSAFFIALGVGRVLLGMSPFLLAQISARLLGVPPSHDNATGRLMARLFGVRDVGLGVLTFWAVAHPEMLPFVAVFNGCTDLGDVGAAAIPLVRREQIDRVAWRTMTMAGSASLVWAFAFVMVVW